MPKIIPIKELKDTAKVSLMVRESTEPIYVTKNGYAEMVIMKAEEYDRMVFEKDLTEKIEVGMRDIREGRVADAFESLEQIRGKYDL